jgi:23S rRNA (uracil1939-C5)-methyltransferase
LDSEPKGLRITSLAAGGDAVGRLADGRVVFVEGGVPGDLVELEAISFGKRMARARVGRVLEASPDRTQPRCPHFGICGGCSWQHIGYAAQLEAKRQIVRDALERIGQLRLEQEVEIIESPDPYRYRARARLVEKAGVVGYRKRGSHDCVEIRECPILVPSAQAKLVVLIDATRAKAELVGDAVRSSKRRDPEWEILAGSAGGAELYRVGSRDDPGKAVQIEVLGELLRASPASFVQSNSLLWDDLAREVVEQSLHAEDSQGARARRFIELHAGIGFLTLPLARAGWVGAAFESERSALRDLAANLDHAGLSDRVQIVAGRVERRGDWEERFTESDLLVVDPPRVGLDASLREVIARSGPERVIYVSCDPATLARDLRLLLVGGYRVADLRAFDLFPQTPHVEVVVRLERT